MNEGIDCFHAAILVIEQEFKLSFAAVRYLWFCLSVAFHSLSVLYSLFVFSFCFSLFVVGLGLCE